ncbi:glycoside hydrolase family 13 protein [Leptotrichia trevisanii]
MEKSAFYHRTESEYAYLYTKDEIHIRLRTKKNDVAQVILHYGNTALFDFTQDYQYHIPMSIITSDLYHDYWQASVKVDYHRISYLFEIVGTDGENVFFGDMGVAENQLHQYKDASNSFRIPYLHDSDRVKIPEWVRDTVWYQIFPERFANGKPEISPINSLAWDTDISPKHDDLFGGDLYGILEKLDYLKDLGITGLYFCPIFEAPSNHKYDTVNYFEIDKHFGNREIFKKLVEEAHKRKMKIMLDAVFNHIGNNSSQWQDIIKNGKNSIYCDWFHIHNFPVYAKTEKFPNIHHYLNYDTFKFSPKLPKLNTSNPEVQQYLLDIATYWIREFDIDAWRLDVANEIDHQFWKKFYKAVTAIKPDIYILGEVWHNAHPWLNGDEFHAVTNYPLATSIKSYFLTKTISTEDFKNQINSQLMYYRQQTNEVMLNMLDSHDTERILTTAKENHNAVKSALVFMFLHLGSPCIYYGTEVGMKGGSDPDCRRVMPWDENKQDTEMKNFVKKLIALRKEYINWIIYGKQNIQTLENDILQVTINYNGSQIIINYNNTNNSIKLSNTGKTLLTNSEFTSDENSIFLKPDTFIVTLL